MAPPHVRDLCRERTSTAVEALTVIAAAGEGAASVAAAECLMRWAWHSPTRAVDGVGHLEGDALVAHLEERMAAFAAAGDHQAAAGCVAALDRLRPRDTPTVDPQATTGVRFLVETK
jgi:hypothetical protein